MKSKITFLGMMDNKPLPGAISEESELIQGAINNLKKELDKIECPNGHKNFENEIRLVYDASSGSFGKSRINACCNDLNSIISEIVSKL